MSSDLRVVAIADADSFVKWSAALLDSVPGIRRHLLLVRTPLTVSREQQRTALAGTGFEPHEVTRLGFDELDGWLGGHLPDVVVLAGRGPFVRLVARRIDHMKRRPVVVSGLPGMSIPAQRGALEYRRESDLVVVHSHREERAFAELGRRIGVDVPIALATLPFARAGERVLTSSSLSPSTSLSPASSLSSSSSLSPSSSLSLSKRAGTASEGDALRQAQGARGVAAQGARGGTALAERPTALAERPTALAERPQTPAALLRPRASDLVFASQALVPVATAERAAIADILRRAAEADPERRVVVKLRSRPGETETHLERDAYADLLASPPPNLVISHEPMAAALDRAEGLVTISSTAAIEAVARGIPVIALDTFGVSKTLLNTVFIGSGLLGSAEEVIGRRFRHPHPDWLRDNYFHPVAESTWWGQVQQLVAQRRAGMLPARPVPAGRGGALHAAWHRKSVLGSEDRSIVGAVALGVGAPLVSGILSIRRSRGRAGQDTWSDASTDYTLEPTPHRDPIRR